MTSFADRLRGVVSSGAPRGETGFPPHDSGHGQPQPNQMDAVADTLGGEWRESRGRRYLVVDRKYRPGHRHGRVAVCDAAPGDGGWPRLDLLTGCAALPASSPERVLFLDLETTGLAGGAGSYAFLVGCAWFDGGTLRVRQFFLSSFTAERALLEEVAALAEDATGLGTYNGKSFDLPLLETRYALHRLETPFAGLPHVDMLHHARRLWRSDDEESPGCRLNELERTLCGHEREGDVPGFEIPARYFDYVRSGDARRLEAVLEHNRLDLLSLALLTARAAQLLEEGPGFARTAREALGLGCLYERGGMNDDARSAFARAAGIGAPSVERGALFLNRRAEPSPLDEARGVLSESRRAGPPVTPDPPVLPADTATRAEALRAYAVLSRRERRYDEAAFAWRRVLDLARCPPPIARQATEALAVHHEHRVRDLAVARRFAQQSLQFQGSLSRTQAVQHRLARLERKLSSPSANHAVLF